MTLNSVVRWAILALILMLALGGAILWAWNMGKQRSLIEARDAGWRNALNAYVDYRNQEDGRITSVLTTVPAAYPERFLSKMSVATWSEDRRFFNTDAAARVSEDSLPPLPYPPTAVHCVALNYQPTTAPELNVPADQEVLVLAYHEASGAGQWVLHSLAARGDAAALQQLLAHLGCDMAAVGATAEP